MTTVSNSARRLPVGNPRRAESKKINAFERQSSQLLERLENSLSLISASGSSPNDNDSLEVVEQLISDFVTLAEARSRRMHDRKGTPGATLDQFDGHQLIGTREAEFENTCLDLLSRADHSVSKIGAASEHNRYYEVTRLGKALLIVLLDFTEETLQGDESIKTLLNAVYQDTKTFERNIEIQAWRTLRQIVGLDVPSKFEFTQAHHQLRDAYGRLIAKVFETCATRFTTPLVSENLNESVELLLQEMRRVW